MKSSHFFLLLPCLVVLVICHSTVCGQTFREGEPRVSGIVVKRDERQPIFSTEYGEISAVRITDGINGSYLLHFFTLEANSLLLPVILNSDMLFFVQDGSGRLNWAHEEGELKSTELKRGDIYRLQKGTIFYLKNDLGSAIDQQLLRIYAHFANADNDLREPAGEPYYSLRNTVLCFGKRILQATFKVPEEVIDELLGGTKQPAIVHLTPETKQMEDRFSKALQESSRFGALILNKKKDKEKKKEKEKEKEKKEKEKKEKEKKEKEKGTASLFNVFKEEKDFENCNGWITRVTRHKLNVLEGTNIGLFMVDLNTGSMLGPHWHSVATEIVIVLQGRGMVQLVSSGISDETENCRNTRFEVEEGDVFAVPKFYTVAQMAFNNETFVFMGLTTLEESRRPRFFGEPLSVLRTLDHNVLAMTFNVTRETLDELLAPQDRSPISSCISCAEEEWEIMREERQERAGGQEEEEQRGRGRGEEEEWGRGRGEGGQWARDTGGDGRKGGRLQDI